MFGNNSVLFKQFKEEPETETIELEKLDDDVLTSLTDDISKEALEIAKRTGKKGKSWIEKISKRSRNEK